MRMLNFARPGALLALALLFLAWPARPALIELTDGSVIRGEISGAADGSCVIRRGNNTPLVVKCGEISRIEATTLPANAAPLAPLRLAGSNTIGARLIPALLTDYLSGPG